MSVAQDNTMCETLSVAVVIIDAGSLFAEGLDLGMVLHGAAWYCL